MKIEEARQILVKEVLAGLYSSSEVTEAIDTILADHAKLEAFVRELTRYWTARDFESNHCNGGMYPDGFDIWDEKHDYVLAHGKDALEALRNLWEQQPQTAEVK